MIFAKIDWYVLEIKSIQMQAWREEFGQMYDILPRVDRIWDKNENPWYDYSWKLTNIFLRSVISLDISGRTKRKQMTALFYFVMHIAFIIQKSLERVWHFWIMNAMYMFMYIFIVYFSFASVISATIHRHVNYIDIQVLIMVTETGTLTSTLHHNIFT